MILWLIHVLVTDGVVSNLVPRVLSYPPSVGRVGENPGNEVGLSAVCDWVFLPPGYCHVNS